MDEINLEPIIRWRLAIIAYNKGFIGSGDLIAKGDEVALACQRYAEELEIMRQKNEETLDSKLDAK